MKTEQQSVEIINKKVKQFPETLVILGSGWSEVLRDVEVEAEISYKDLFGVEASVPGHEGRLVVGRVANELMSDEFKGQVGNTKTKSNSSTQKPINPNSTRVAFMAGRMHMYEGYSAREATLPIRVFAQAGIKQMIVTAAAGALNEHYQVGDFVIASDILTLFMSLDNPLVGPDFVDLSQVFDPELRQIAIQVCAENKIPFQQGVYCFIHGPNFETPADKMALRHMGADVVGMSTVPETIMARSLGVKVLALPFVTNLAFVKHDHQDVLAAAEKSSEQMASLLKGIMSRL